MLATNIPSPVTEFRPYGFTAAHMIEMLRQCDPHARIILEFPDRAYVPCNRATADHIREAEFSYPVVRLRY